MKSIFQFFLDNYKLGWLVTAMFLFMGITAVKNIKRESRPPVDFATSVITVAYPGASPEEVEDLIINPIEKEIKPIEGIKDIRSTAQSGLAVIVIRLDMDNYDTTEVSDDLQRALQKVTGLPADLRTPPQYSSFNAKEIPVLEIALTGPNENRQRDLYIEEIESLLEDDPGVSAINFSGYREREFQILLSPSKMKFHHIGIQQVISAIQASQQNIPAGFIRTEKDKRLVRVKSQSRTVKEMRDIIIRSNFDGQSVRISDVAEVKDSQQDLSVLIRMNGDPASFFTVKKRADADAIRLVERVKEKLDKYKTTLPEGYKFVTYDNEADRVGKRLGIVVGNAMIGLVLVLLCMVLFLPGALGLTASLSLPVSILATLGIMYLNDINFNNVTLLAVVIAIGMLVDNSVVISENYARLRGEGRSAKEAALKAAYQFWLPLLATVMTTIVAFLPMMVTKGIMGEFIKWIPIVVCISLVMSLIEAFFLLPARLQFTLKSDDAVKKSQAEGGVNFFRSGVAKLQINFEKFMVKCIRHRYVVLVVLFVALTLTTLLSAFGNKFELFPSDEVTTYFASFEAPASTSVETSDIVAADLVKKIRETLPEDLIVFMLSRAGWTRDASNQTKNAENVGYITIELDEEKSKAYKPKEILAKLRTIKDPRLKILTFKTRRGGPSIGRALSVSFRGRNFEELEGVVGEFKEQVSKVDGVVELVDNNDSSGPEYRLIPNRPVMKSLNLSSRVIGQALRSALQGTFASEMSMNGREVSIKVRYDDESRETIDTLRKALIMEPSGKLIPLSSVVDIVPSEGPSVRRHYNFKKSMSVSSGIDKDIISSIELNDKAKVIFDSISAKYPGVTATFGGEQESTNESTDSLKSAMIIAVVSIFCILVVLFRSYMASLLILSSIPLSLIGVSLAFFLHGRPLSFFALIGVVGLAGVVVNAAIVLVSYIGDLRKDGVERIKSLSVASSHRLRAVMVTGLTTVGGLLPTAYGIGGYDSVLVPMTLALSWGLISGTLLTLIWVPCGYAIIDDIRGFIKRRFQGGKTI